MKLRDIIEAYRTPPSIGPQLAGGYLQPDTIEGEEESADRRTRLIKRIANKAKRFVVFARPLEGGMEEEVLAHNVNHLTAINEIQKAIQFHMEQSPNIKVTQTDENTWELDDKDYQMKLLLVIEPVTPGNVYGGD